MGVEVEQTGLISSELAERLRKFQGKIREKYRYKNHIFAIYTAALSEGAEQLCGELSGELESKLQTNDLVLVVKQEESEYGASPRLWYSVDTELYLGVLTSSSELTSGKEFVLSTDKHAKKSERHYRQKKWELQDGPIKINWYDFILNFGRDAEKEVRERAIFSEAVPYSACENGLLVYKNQEVEQYFSEYDVDVSYLDALNLLGLKSSEEFMKRYEEEMLNKSIKIVNELERLMQLEASLKGEVSAIYGAVGSGLIKNGAVMFVEDKTDALFASWGQREKIEHTQRSIRSKLGEALDLGIHKRDLKLQEKPGITMNVPEYILGICEGYKVKV